MKEKVIQVVTAVVLGFIFSSGVALIEESGSANSIANDNNNHDIQVKGSLDVVPPYPPPPPPGDDGN